MDIKIKMDLKNATLKQASELLKKMICCLEPEELEKIHDANIYSESAVSMNIETFDELENDRNTINQA